MRSALKLLGDALRDAGAYVSPDETELIPVFSASGRLLTGFRTPAALFARSRSFLVPSCGNAKVGATAGWVITGGTNKGHATLPASQTASTLVLPVQGLSVGDTITAFSLVGQIESAGGAVTLDADLRMETAAAADNTDASLGAITQIAVTADAIISASKTLATPQVVAANQSFYILLTGTTAASTDIDLLGALIVATKS